MATRNVPFSPGSPAALGYRMPAEWEPHAATWLAWPHNPDPWPGKLPLIPPVWVEMVRALAPGETVNVLVNEEVPAAAVQEQLARAGVAMANVRVHELPTNDAWLRDSGPTFLTRAGAGGIDLAAVAWEYNAWGGKYPPWDRDARVGRRIAELVGAPVFRPGIVLEGGAIDVDGRGAVLTTEACLLNPNRNPHLDRGAIEQRLRDYLGVHRVLWLGDGIAGDDTDGHVDDLARFVAPRTVVTVVEHDRRDENYEPLRANHARLVEMADEQGEPLRIVTLPMPAPIVHDGQRLPASYANFYIGNRVVLVPTFAQSSDAVALEILRSLFPGRTVVGIHAVDMILGLGAFHCVTQQQPGRDG
jgi:agmatine deiminase